MRLITKVFSSLYQVLIYKIVVLLQLYQFWNIIQNKLVDKNSNITNIRVIKMRLLKLQDNDKKAKKLKVKRLTEGWKNIKKILYYQELQYFFKIICFELINRYYNN